MKKLLLIAALIALSATAFAEMKAPTVYGMLVKDIQYVDQETKFNKTPITMAGDVYGGWSRLGVKGTHMVDNMAVSYTLEFGFNSASAAFPIIIRHGFISLTDVWGTLLVGQTWTASSLMGIMLDPMALNAGGFHAGDTGMRTGKTGTSLIGYPYRGRRNLVGYTTPVFQGLQLAMTVDKDQYSSGTGGTADPYARGEDTTTGERAATYVDSMLTFRKDLGAAKLAVYAKYESASGGARAFDTVMGLGSQVKFGMFGITGMWAKQAFENPALQNREEEYVTMMGTGSIYLGKNTITIGYSSKDSDTKVLNTAEDKDSQTRIALGYNYDASEAVSYHAGFAMDEIKYDGPIAAAANDNKANSVYAGIKVVF